MPNLVSSGGGGSGVAATEAILWDPSLNEIRDNDKFYGFRFYPANAKLIIHEIADDAATPIQLPDYRVGDGRIGANGLYIGGETFANASANVGRLQSFNPYDHDVYKNWMTSQSALTFSWYTGTKTHLLVEVA